MKLEWPDCFFLILSIYCKLYMKSWVEFEMHPPTKAALDIKIGSCSMTCEKGDQNLKNEQPLDFGFRRWFLSLKTLLLYYSYDGWRGLNFKIISGKTVTSLFYSKLILNYNMNFCYFNVLVKQSFVKCPGENLFVQSSPHFHYLRAAMTACLNSLNTKITFK